MDHDRDVEFGGKLEETETRRVVGIAALQARGDPRTLEAVLADRALELAQELVRRRTGRSRRSRKMLSYFSCSIAT